MKASKWIPVITVSALGGAAAGLLSMAYFKQIDTPYHQPPEWWAPIVWGVLGGVISGGLFSLSHQ